MLIVSLELLRRCARIWSRPVFALTSATRPPAAVAPPLSLRWRQSIASEYVRGTAAALAVVLWACATQAIAAGSADVPAAASTRVSRPSYNSGDGFFVWQGRLYDSSGNEFRIRGVNRLHWDSDSAAGIAASHANTVRWDIDFSRPESANVALVRTQSIAHREVPVVGNWNATCSEEPTRLSAVVDVWVRQAPAWTRLNRDLIVNIANEWGPGDSAVWRDSYIEAVKALRAAGYLGTILVDSGGCGQDINDLLHYSGAIFESDPQKNVMFALHIYGRVPRDQVAPDLRQLAELSHSAGMAFVVGEFGPGRSTGPSPTKATPGEVITAAESNGIGWLAWAWDDNDLADGASDDNWFSMTYRGPGIFHRPSDLTVFGRDIVLNPVYGLEALAAPASVFR